MPVIELRNGSAKASIDTQGAYLAELTDRGDLILFTRQHIGEKTRGGMPVCAPIFGPGESVGLSQHGFARDVKWTLEQKTENTLTLSFDAASREDIPPAYRGCAMLLMFSLRETKLVAMLHIENRGETPFVCSPGFHPYFSASDATKVSIVAGRSYMFDSSELAATQFLFSKQGEIGVDLTGMHIIIESNSLQQYAVWSANPDRYICVEPTFTGNLDTSKNLPLLNPGEKSEFSMTLQWTGAV